jgi:REP element-mobilizing transposase RayT
VKEDHVHLFLAAPPPFMKSISAKVAFREFSEVEKQLWNDELGSDGYFVRPIGCKATMDVIVDISSISIMRN